MTVSTCLAYCAQGYNSATMQYAGLEYVRPPSHPYHRSFTVGAR